MDGQVNQPKNVNENEQNGNEVSLAEQKSLMKFDWLPQWVCDFNHWQMNPSSQRKSFAFAAETSWQSRLNFSHSRAPSCLAVPALMEIDNQIANSFIL